MLIKVFTAVARVIVNPQKGQRFYGVRGDVQQMKGMLGLVLRPETGTLDLVT